MMTENKVLSITPDVSWVGIPDHDIVTFDIVMETRYGTTYNSYFINAGKKVIIDTAKATFKDLYIDKIRKVVDPAEIDYIITTHTEPDHSGSLKYLLDIAPKAVVYGSRQAIGYLQEMIKRPFSYQFVKDGDILDIGGKTIEFISAPNLHWPDTIYAFLREDGLLFTCDSFGAHFCNDAMFDDLTGDYDDAFKYYFDVILKPFSSFMLKAIEKISDLPLKMVCPGHGPILRSTWKKKITITREYSEKYLASTLCTDNAILIAYVSAYGYTRQMAEAIIEGIGKEGTFKIYMADIENMLPGDLEELIACSKYLLIGSPTINQNTLFPVYRMFSLINPVRDRGKKAFVFGSYGWSGEAVKIIESNLKNLKLDVISEGITCKFLPDGEKYAELVDFGRQLAKMI
jgi:NADH oxidase (H2O-forming)